MAALAIESSRFGHVEIDPATVIEFPDGLIGLGGSRYALLAGEPDSPFVWLHCIDDPTLSLPVTDPHRFFSGGHPSDRGSWAGSYQQWTNWTEHGPGPRVDGRLPAILRHRCGSAGHRSHRPNRRWPAANGALPGPIRQQSGEVCRVQSTCEKEVARCLPIGRSPWIDLSKPSSQRPNLDRYLYRFAGYYPCIKKARTTSAARCRSGRLEIGAGTGDERGRDSLR